MTKHILIDIEGNSYNIDLKIKNNKLYAIWDKEPLEVKLNETNITIKDE